MAAKNPPPPHPADHDSDVGSNIVVAAPTQTASVNAAAAVKNLSRLGAIIEAELKAWMTHLQGVSHIPTYESITSSGNSPSVKSAALLHVLETIPGRHKALASAYNAEETVQIELSDRCNALQEELKASGARGEGLDLTGYYDHKLFRGKRFRADMLALEKEMVELEGRRREELEELMTMFEELKILWEEDWLSAEQVDLLVGAMDDVGLSASSALQEGSGG